MDRPTTENRTTVVVPERENGNGVVRGLADAGCRIERVDSPSDLAGIGDPLVLPAAVSGESRRSYLDRATSVAPEARRVVLVDSPEAVDGALSAGATDVVVEADHADPAAAVRDRTNRDRDRPAVPEAVGRLFEGTHDASVVVDDRWYVARITGAVERLLDVPAERLREEHLWLATPETGEPIAARLRAARDADEATTVGAHLPGLERWIELTALPRNGGLVVGIRDVTERERIHQEGERLERLIATIDDGVYTLDANFRIQSVNDAILSLTGHDRAELQGAHASLLASEETIAEAATAIERLRAGEEDVGVLETEIERADGGTVPIETRFSTLTHPNGESRHVGVVRDITDRKRYERTLTTLNRSIQSFMAATTPAAVCEQAVEAARTELSFPAVAAYLFDESSNLLEPAAVAGEGSRPDLAALGSDTDAWTRFVAGDRTLAPDDGGHPLVADDQRCLYAPLDDHGLLIAAVSEESVPRATTELVELLAANAAAALDRLDRQSELEHHREALAERAAELERVNRFNELVRDLNAALVEARTREGIERAVCDRLAAADSIALAWIGDREDGIVSARARAGRVSYVEGLSAAVGEDAEPAARALATGEVVSVDNVAERLGSEPWCRSALAHDLQSALSLPLAYDGFSYGVLSVYAESAAAFADPVGDTLSKLADTIANALNDVEARRTLATGAVTEVELRFSDPDSPLPAVASAVGATIDLEGATPEDEGSRLYVTAESPSAEDPAGAAAGVAGVREARKVASREESVSIELAVGPESVPGVLAGYGAAVPALTATDAEVRATVELPSDADIRRFVESVRKSYPDAELAARRFRERSHRSPDAFYDRVTDALTERQLEALRRSYLAGYFGWPRDTTGEEVADSMDIAQPTYAKHLRSAERKLFSLLFDGS